MRWVVCSFVVSLSMLSAGCGVPSFLITPVSSSTTLQERVVQRGKGLSPDKVAIIEVEGMLMNVRAGGFLQPQENKVSLFTQQMRAAARDPSVKAVVLRVNSPGGTVTASDTMYETVRNFRRVTKKPVIASTQEVAASGGYYVACAADRVIVQPTSVVGSIGVIFESVQFKGAMDKLGITSEAIKSGSLKDMGSPFKLLRDDEKEVMQEMVDEYFTRFVTLVRQRRPQLKEEVVTDLDAYKKPGYAGVFSGRVYSGAKAVELGLADRTGLLTDAIDAARKRANVPNAGAILYKRPYGYGGSIYANTQTPTPKSNVLRLELPEMNAFLPDGFYYLWRP